MKNLKKKEKEEKIERAQTAVKFGGWGIIREKAATRINRHKVEFLVFIVQELLTLVNKSSL
jgi:hypothetical protein